MKIYLITALLIMLHIISPNLEAQIFRKLADNTTSKASKSKQRESLQEDQGLTSEAHKKYVVRFVFSNNN